MAFEPLFWVFEEDVKHVPLPSHWKASLQVILGLSQGEQLESLVAGTCVAGSVLSYKCGFCFRSQTAGWNWWTEIPPALTLLHHCRWPGVSSFFVLSTFTTLTSLVPNPKSLNIVECPKFRKLLLFLQSDLRESFIPHQTKLCKLIIQAWRQHFQVLRCELAVHLPQLLSHLFTFFFQSRLLWGRFPLYWIHGPINIADCFWQSLPIGSQVLEDPQLYSLRWHSSPFTASARTTLANLWQELSCTFLTGLTSWSKWGSYLLIVIDGCSWYLFSLEVGHFTLNNASNNGTMMEELKMMLTKCNIAFNVEDRRIMCFVHVVDLCSRCVICAVSDRVEPGNDGSSSNSDTTVSNPIALARMVVWVIRGSGSRRDIFDDVIICGNAKGWFKQGKLSWIVQVKPLQLLQDVRTRWDLVHHMLKRLREMCLVCLCTSPKFYALKINLTGCWLLLGPP